MGRSRGAPLLCSLRLALGVGLLLLGLAAGWHESSPYRYGCGGYCERARVDSPFTPYSSSYPELPLTGEYELNVDSCEQGGRPAFVKRFTPIDESIYEMHYGQVFNRTTFNATRAKANWTLEYETTGVSTPAYSAGDMNLTWFNGSWIFSSQNVVADTSPDTAPSIVQLFESGAGGVAVEAYAASSIPTPPANGWTMTCADGELEECPWHDDAGECHYCPWRNKAPCECSQPSGQDAFVAQSVQFYAAGRQSTAHNWGGTLAEGYLIKEDYLNTDYVDIETAPHKNGNGLFVAFDFVLGPSTTITPGEKIVLVIPHLMPLLDQNLLNMSNYVAQIGGVAYDNDQDDFAQRVDNTAAENFVVERPWSDTTVAALTTAHTLHSLYRCTSDCDASGLFDVTYEIHSEDSDENFDKQAQRYSVLDANGDSLDQSYKHYSLILTVRNQTLPPGKHIHIGVKVDPQYACDENPTTATSAGVAWKDRTPLMRKGVYTGAAADVATRYRSTTAVKEECVKWSTMLRPNDELWTITSDTASVKVFPPISFTQSDMFGVTCNRAAKLQGSGGYKLGKTDTQQMMTNYDVLYNCPVTHFSIPAGRGSGGEGFDSVSQIGTDSGAFPLSINGNYQWRSTNTEATGFVTGESLPVYTVATDKAFKIVNVAQRGSDVLMGTAPLADSTGTVAPPYDGPTLRGDGISYAFDATVIANPHVPSAYMCLSGATYEEKKRSTASAYFVLCAGLEGDPCDVDTAHPNRDHSCRRDLGLRCSTTTGTCVKPRARARQRVLDIRCMDERKPVLATDTYTTTLSTTAASQNAVGQTTVLSSTATQTVTTQCGCGTSVAPGSECLLCPSDPDHATYIKGGSYRTTNRFCPLLRVKGSTYMASNLPGESLDSNGDYLLVENSTACAVPYGQVTTDGTTGAITALTMAHGHWMRPFGLISLHIFRYAFHPNSWQAAYPDGATAAGGDYWFMTRRVQDMTDPLSGILDSTDADGAATTLTVVNALADTARLESYGIISYRAAAVKASTVDTTRYVTDEIPPSAKEHPWHHMQAYGIDWATTSASADLVSWVTSSDQGGTFQETTTAGTGKTIPDDESGSLLSWDDVVFSPRLEFGCGCLTMTEPTAGLTYRAGEAMRITWSSACFCEVEYVEISLFHGKDEIAKIATNAEPSGTMLWAIAANYTAEAYYPTDQAYNPTSASFSGNEDGLFPSGSDFRVRLRGFQFANTMWSADDPEATEPWFSPVRANSRPVYVVRNGQSANGVANFPKGLPAYGQIQQLEEWSDPFEIRRKPVRQIPPGAYRDLVLTVGITGVTEGVFSTEAQQMLLTGSLQMVHTIDDQALAEVVDVIRCPCSSVRPYTRSSFSTFRAPVSPVGHSTRRLSEQQTVIAATGYSSDGNTTLQMDGIQVDIRFEVQDAMDGRWERREALALCHQTYEDQVSAGAPSSAPMDAFAPCSMGASIAREFPIHVTSGGLKTTLGNMSLANATAGSPGFYANSNITVVTPPKEGSMPSSTVEFDMETLICTEMLQSIDTRELAILNNPGGQSATILGVARDEFGLADARLACEAKVVPQLDATTREVIQSFVAGATNASAVPRVCIAMAEAATQALSPPYTFTLESRSFCADGTALARIANKMNDALIRSLDEMETWLNGKFFLEGAGLAALAMCDLYDNCKLTFVSNLLDVLPPARPLDACLSAKNATDAYPPLLYLGASCCHPARPCVVLNGANTSFASVPAATGGYSHASGNNGGSTFAYRALSEVTPGISLVPAVPRQWEFVAPSILFTGAAATDTATDVGAGATFTGAQLEFEFRGYVQVERYSLVLEDAANYGPKVRSIMGRVSAGEKTGRMEEG